ncbi:MAG: hypothetical protein QW156_04845 [Candidatus Aenigmatarchaeota archaeon]
MITINKKGELVAINEVRFSNKVKSNFSRILGHFEQVLKRSVPINTGTLKASIRVNRFERGRTYGAKVYAPFYFDFLDKGTKRHYIAPVHAKALRWFEFGEIYFSKGHEVAGIAPMNLLLKAKRVVMDNWKRGLI